ncbi:MAG: UvrD-helicase domain-containing protein [Nitrospiraceae bacterium]
MAAETTFDRNIVVEAGAGTGKTTLLVNRFLNLLLREPGSIPITKVAALTFSNKAATEMKVRLRKRLLSLASLSKNREVATQESRGRSDMEQEEAVRQMDSLRGRYGLSTEEIIHRAEAALQDVEKAQIGTLHSFAAHLLRLYPLESGVPPQFQEDDGLRFEEHLTASWRNWIDCELGAEGRRHPQWKRVLTQVRVDQLRELARELCNELISLDDLLKQVCSATLPEPVKQWMADSVLAGEKILARRAGSKGRKTDEMLQAAVSLLTLLLAQGVDGLRCLGEAERLQLDREIGGCPKSWSEHDFVAASSLIKVAQACLRVDRDLGKDVLELLVPFASKVRRSFVESGWLSFDGLTARARALLRDHPSVRERLKHEYRALLVDEFQDTDPVQYELVLYLSERLGQQARSWQEVDLEAGKLFIVGDPKQSIYAFRRADIEAFDRVVYKLRTWGGEIHNLTTNFRSHGSVLAVVNEVFDRVFIPQRHLQPDPVRLDVKPNRPPLVGRPGVELRLVTHRENEDDFDSASATRAEAESLAQWLAEELLPRERCVDERGTVGPIKPGHVAILFRKLTQAQEYLDAFRRQGIAYVTDGEKHFYRRQEVIDLVNLLRVLENPNDAIAMAGVLRSSLGGLSDRDLFEVSSRHAMDYRRPERLASWHDCSTRHLQRLYHELRQLHYELPRLPLSDGLERVFARLPVLELAAASLHGEQAVANLLKVQQMAESLSGRPSLTLNGFVEEMIRRLEDQPQESEGALAEDSLEAVHVLTIHKAKGLEFPIVILPGLHQGTRGQGSSALIGHDWSSGLYGLWLADGRAQTLGSVLVQTKQRAREEAEQRRVLYVGMTRAKDRLLLSGGVTGRSGPDTVCALLAKTISGGFGDERVSELTIGDAVMRQTVVVAPSLSHPSQSSWVGELKPSAPESSAISIWAGRTARWHEAKETSRMVTPSGLVEAMSDHPGWRHQRDGKERSRRIGQVIGVLAHRLLEQWDYGGSPAEFPRLIETHCRSQLPPDCETDRARIQSELEAIFDVYGRSEPYRLLQRSELIGREVPFLIPWKAAQSQTAEKDRVPGQVMTGTIDVIYRLNGEIWVADYKTDDVEENELPELIRRYAWQVQVYQAAVRQVLAIEPAGFQFIVLRKGMMIAA